MGKRLSEFRGIIEGKAEERSFKFTHIGGWKLIGQLVLAFQTQDNILPQTVYFQKVAEELLN